MPKRWALNSQLLLAIQNNDVTRASKLFGEGIDTDIRFTINSEKRPAICICVENNDVDMVHLMIGLGASVNQYDSNGQTALHITCEHGYLSLAKLLLNNRADVQTKNKHGETPLHLASKMGRTDLVKLLLAYGANINTTDKLGRTPLHYAALVSHSQALRYLLEAGVNPRIEDKHGNTSLHLAVDSLGTDLEGISALSRAYPVAALKPNLQKKTPLHILAAADRKEGEEALRIIMNEISSMGLSNSPTVLSPRSQRGHTPLHLAVLERNLPLVRVLIASGAEVDTRDQLGRTPLECAVRDSDWSTVALLLAAGASVRGLISRGVIMPQVKDDTISEMLIEAAFIPMKLTSLCRRAISMTWGLTLQRKLHELPRVWRSYLSYEDL